MKKLTTILAATAAAFALNSQAATSNAPFNVVVNLTSSCAVQGAIADVVFDYTSFGGAVASTGGGFSVKCTNGLPYTFSVAAPGGTVAGLTYTLGTSAAGGTGNGAAQGYSITGSMAAGQGGTCATAGGVCSGTNAHTLTITY